MSFDAGSIVSKLILDKKGFDASVKVVKKGVKDLGKYVDKNSDKIKHMGRTMTIAGGAMVGALGLAVKSAISFNKQMANVATLVPNSTKRILELKKGVQDLAIETGKSTTDISDGLYQVISAFGDTAETAEILETNVLAAAAGMATTSDAIFLTSAVMKGYGDVSAESTKKVADLAFQTVKLGQTAFPELARSMGRAIPVAAKLGVTQEELFAGFATLTGVTGDATMVTTQLFAAMNSIMKPSKDMAIAIGKLGYTSAETMVAELGLVGSMRALVKTTDGSVESVGKLVPNIRALPAVFALTGGQAEVFDEKLIKMNASAGAMDEAFREMSEGINKTGFNMGQLKEMTVVLTQRIGDSLTPVLGDLVLSAGKIVTEISDWIKEHPKLTAIIAKAALGIGALMVALGPLLMALPGLIAALPLVKKGFLKLVPSLKTLKGSISGVSGLLKSLPAVAMAAFAGWEVGKAIGKIKILGKSIDDHIVGAFDNAIEALGLFRSKAEMTGETAEKLAGRVKFLAEHKAKMTAATKEAKDALVDLTKEGLKPGSTGTEDLDNKTKALAETVKNLIPKIIDERTEVEKLNDEYWDLMGTVFNGKEGWNKYLEQALKVKERLKELTGGVKELDMAIDDDAENWIDFGDKVEGVLEGMGYGIGSIPDDVEEAATKTKTIWGDLADGLQTKWASMTGEVLRGATSLKDGLKGVWDSIVVQFTDMIGTILAKFTTDLVSGIISGASKAGSAVSTLAGGASTLGLALEGLIAGVASILPTIATAIASAAKILFGALPEIAAIAAVALAIYAGFMAVNALFGSISSGGGMMDATNRELHNIWEEARNTFQNTDLMVGQLDTLKKIGWTMQSLLAKIRDKLIGGGTGGTGGGTVDIDSTATNNLLKQIRGNTALIREWTKRTFEALKGKGGGWATGFEGIVSEPMRPLIGESGPEYVKVQPISEMKKASSSPDITVYNTVNLNGTIITDREYTRDRMMPEIVSALEANLEKTRIKQILGIA